MCTYHCQSPTACRLGLSNSLGCSHERGRNAVDLGILYGVPVAGNLSRAVMCIYLATCVHAGSVQSGLRPTGGTGLWSVLLLQILGQSSPGSPEPACVPMAGLVWANFKPLVSKYMSACLDGTLC